MENMNLPGKSIGRVFFILILGYFVFNAPGIQEKGYAMGSMNVPTVTVIDEETGDPIEGAVAIAIWRKWSGMGTAFWEGGSLDVVKIEEAVSDKDGKIFIDGFWGWHISQDRYPRLTIYKFGYVCWDQKRIFKGGKREDFDKNHRIAKMAIWKKGLSFNEHEGFIFSSTQGDIRNAPKKLFSKAFDYETSFSIAESHKKDEVWRKEREEGRKSHIEKKKGGEEQ